MRRLILMLALATVAGPAMAEPQDGWNARRGGRGEERQERAPDAPRTEAPHAEAPRAEAPRMEVRRYEAPQAEAPHPEAPRAETPRYQARPVEVLRSEAPRGNWERSQAAQASDAGQASRWRERSEQRRAEQAGDGTAPATRWSDHVRQSPSGGWNAVPEQARPVPVVRYGNRNGGERQWSGSRDGYQGQHAGTQDGYHHVVTGSNEGRQWTNDWRRDSRYDWRRYRQHNRSIFNLGRYYDPFGWGYRRVSIGFRLYAGYYQSNYWLDDPWQYRLPPVYGPYRWVRYYDDALLIDIYSGQVVDVIEGFFW
ncbi:MAG: RcnB family protein [Sphingomicrobium sp.]